MDENIDLAELNAYLSSDDSPEDCMMLSDLDGFLHGVVCSPVAIPSEDWMSLALGADLKRYPWRSSKTSLICSMASLRTL